MKLLPAITVWNLLAIPEVVGASGGAAFGEWVLRIVHEKLTVYNPDIMPFISTEQP